MRSMWNKMIVTLFGLTLVACAPTQTTSTSKWPTLATGQRWELQPLAADKVTKVGQPYTLFVGEVPTITNATWKSGATVYYYYIIGKSVTNLIGYLKLENHMFSTYSDLNRKFSVDCTIANLDQQSVNNYIGLLTTSNMDNADQLKNDYLATHTLPVGAETCSLKLIP